jgi:hypothetical protein
MSNPDHSDDSTMRDEYDFARGTRGKYADRYGEGSNVVVLDPDIAAEFPTEECVNQALRVYLARKKAEEGAA